MGPGWGFMVSDNGDPFGAPSEVIKSVYEINPDALEAIFQVLETRGIRTPISQVVGFSQFLVQPASDVATQELTNSAAYVDLATVGPSLTLGDGKYLLFFGCWIVGGAPQGFMSLSVNGSGGSDATAVTTGGGGATTSISRVITVALSSGTNTVVSKYRTAGAGNSFSNRWLLAIRYSNIR